MWASGVLSGAAAGSRVAAGSTNDTTRMSTVAVSATIQVGVDAWVELVGQVGVVRADVGGAAQTGRRASVGSSGRAGCARLNCSSGGVDAGIKFVK